MNQGSLPLAEYIGPLDPPLLSFIAYGEAKPAGSKVAGVATKMQNGRRVPVMGPSGFPKTFTKDSSGAEGKAWRESVKVAAVEANGEGLITGPLRVEFIFYKPRPAGHYGTGRNAGVVKPSAPRYPDKRPDVLKLARAVEDALTGVLWRDDSQIIVEHLRKLYGEPARVEVSVWPL